MADLIFLVQMIMNKQKPTKYYSSKQEKMIAEYLGWKQVSASGARRFNPGDIISDRFLCECKTHENFVDRIEIPKATWEKISSEAFSVFRIPVLFIDNGTQKAENTWFVTPKKFFELKNYAKVNVQTSVTSAKIAINYDYLSKIFNCKYMYAEITINNDLLLLSKLEFFKCICFGI